jgi:hypothetical protein
MRSLEQAAAEYLHNAGLDADLIDATRASGPYGDSEAVFKLHSVLIRFVRDRRQEFVDVAAVGFPERFFQFDDLAIMMGWTSIPDVLAKTKPDEIDVILECIHAHNNEVQRAFSPDQWTKTRSQLEEVENQRGHEFVRRLRGEQK